MGMNALEVRRRVMMAQPHEAVASGAVASFRTDVVSALPMEFELVPIQDLHGQANPYPPGGGKNLFGGQWPPSVSGTYAGWEMPATTYCRLALYDKGNNADISGVYFGMSENGTSTPVTWIVTNGSLYEPTYDSTNNCYAIGYSNRKYVTIYPATQEALTKIMNRFNVYCFVDDTNRTWTYAPYSNNCPITGHDGFKRTGTGKNLLDQSKCIPKRYINIRGNVSTSDGWSASDYVQIKGGQTYTFSGYVQTGWSACTAFYDREKTFISADYSFRTATFTAPDNAVYVRLSIMKEVPTVAQLELGSTASDFEAYKGTIEETTFPTPPGTVYGGHVTDNGDGTYDLTVNKAKWVFNGDSTIVWTYTVDGNGNIRVYTTGMKDYITFSSNVIANYIRDTGKNQAYPAEWCCSINTYGTILIGLPASFTSATDWKNYLESNNLEVVYELKNPVQYTDLSLTVLQSLIGQNHIWVDNADSVTVEYWGH